MFGENSLKTISILCVNLQKCLKLESITKLQLKITIMSGERSLNYSEEILIRNHLRKELDTNSVKKLINHGQI